VGNQQHQPENQGDYQAADRKYLFFRHFGYRLPSGNPAIKRQWRLPRGGIPA
jgi:hypothetical protein